jgi:hypothetical protein
MLYQLSYRAVSASPGAETRRGLCMGYGRLQADFTMFYHSICFHLVESGNTDVSSDLTAKDFTVVIDHAPAHFVIADSCGILAFSSGLVGGLGLLG